LPLDQLKLPPGFRIEVYASGIANARSLRVGNRGTVFVGSAGTDKVHAIIDDNGRRRMKVLVSGLHRPNGLAYHDGTLYIAEVSKISKIDNVENTLDDPPKPMVIYDGLPKDEAHGARFIAVGPDGKLYIAVGPVL
jgi:glucose/arabinose dehydrogenase